MAESRLAVAEFYARLTGRAASLPDFVLWPEQDLLISLSRELAAWALRRPTQAEFRFFVLPLTGAQPEAQNALLKTLEEAPPTSRFFLLSTRADLFIPTVVSRLCLWRLAPSNLAVNIADGAKAFARGRLDERLAMVNEWLRSEADLVPIFSGLEQFWQSNRSKLLPGVFGAGVAVLSQARRDIAQRGLPTRLALEVLALRFPLI